MLEFKNINRDEIVNILNSKEVFAENLHGNIAKILNLPPHSVGFGYRYLDNAEERDHFEKTFGVKVEIIGK